MREEETNLIVEMLSVLRYFPAASGARALIADDLSRMCGTVDQAKWLVRRMVCLYTEWPGLKEMRAVLCSKFRPLDGQEVFSDVYLDGIPQERKPEPLLLEGKLVHALPAGHSASVDPELEVEVIKAAKALKMAPLPKYYARSEDEKRVDAELRQMFKLGDGEKVEK